MTVYIVVSSENYFPRRIYSAKKEAEDYITRMVNGGYTRGDFEIFEGDLNTNEVDWV